MTDEVALEPISDADWPEDIADMLGGFAGGLNVYRTMAHHPDLLRAWTDLREHVVNRNVLGRQRTEVVILRTGHRLGSSYEWHQHVVRGRKYGLGDARIDRIRGPVAAMPPEDAVLAQAVDELYDAGGLTRATVQSLTRAVGTKGVFDLMATVGFYSTLGFILNSFGTPLDDDIQAELDSAPFQPGDAGA
ncbi:carboxymuconolactone decarboxylase family protein [Sedimentitalea sp. HM32M-2]|uniref:carboxymuconolactone decarboxylase family protein n=1 Tax=Sedimentitalea sp. HM32M-2 TaxID=3351566 RepID=UPI003624D868